MLRGGPELRGRERELGGGETSKPRYYVARENESGSACKHFELPAINCSEEMKRLREKEANRACDEDIEGLGRGGTGGGRMKSLGDGP